MTEEKTIDRESQETRKDRDEFVFTEEELRRRIKDMNGNTRYIKVTNVETAAFQCTRNGTDRYSVTLYNPELTIDIDLRNMLPDEKAVEFVEQYNNGQKVYATLINIRLGESTQTYIGEISVEKQDAIEKYEKFKQHQNSAIPLSVRGYGKRLVYGREQSIRKYLPDLLDSERFRISRSNNIVVVIASIVALMYALGQILPILYIPTILSILLLLPLGYHIGKGTSEMYKTNINPEKLRKKPQREITVLECEYSEDSEKLEIKAKNQDTSWVFEKSEEGELPDGGKKAYEQMKIVGNSETCMIPVSEPEFTDVDYILSEDGEYTILH